MDEGLRDYLTKYDCSSADINPIGAWAAPRFAVAVLFIPSGNACHVIFPFTVHLQGRSIRRLLGHPQLPPIAVNLNHPANMGTLAFAGGISKADLRSFLQWGAVHLGYPALAEVEAAREC